MNFLSALLLFALCALNVFFVVQGLNGLNSVWVLNAFAAIVSFAGGIVVLVKGD